MPKAARQARGGASTLRSTSSEAPSVRSATTPRGGGAPGARSSTRASSGGRDAPPSLSSPSAAPESSSNMRPPESSTVPAASRYERLRGRHAAPHVSAHAGGVRASAATGAHLVRSFTACLTYAFCALPMKDTLAAGSAPCAAAAASSFPVAASPEAANARLGADCPGRRMLLAARAAIHARCGGTSACRAAAQCGSSSVRARTGGAASARAAACAMRAAASIHERRRRLITSTFLASYGPFIRQTLQWAA